jgi:arylsulfatase
VGGWSEFESSGPLRFIWSSGPKSSLRLFVDTPDQLTLSIRARAFAHPDARFEKQRITVSLNGERLDEFAIDASIEHHVLPLPFDRVKRGWNEIDFAYAWTQAPADVVPGSVDERELAVAYEEVRVLRSRHATDAVTVRGAGASDAQPALLQRDAGDFSYLLRVPEDARLEVGWTAASGGGDAQLQIEIETDEGATTLFEGAVARDGAAHKLDLDLAPWSGRFARLRFALGDLPPRARWFWTKLALVAASPAVAVAPAPAPSLRGVNVVFVLLDASNRAHFGPWGSDRGTTPNLDALVPESLVFDAAHAHASYTLASTASLFTSLLPPQHGVVEKRDRLGPEPPTLASALRQAGYATAAFSANIFVARAFGMERGFETFEELFRGKTGGVVAAATDFDAPVAQWLDGVAAGARSGARPFFLYLHFVQPHEPYDIAPRDLYRDLDPAYRGPIDGSVASMYKVYDGQVTPNADDVAQLQRLYEGNIRFADAALGRLVERLRRDGLLERTLLIVTADHGEALGEGGRFGHNASVDESMTSIPLLVRLPAELRRTGRFTQNVGSIDLAPMILETAALPVPASFQGRNPLRTSPEPLDDRVIYARSAGAAPQVALWIDDWKYVYDGGTRRLSKMDAPDVVAADESAHRPVSLDFFEAARRSLEAGKQGRAESVGNLSSGERDALKALGYLRE